MDVSAEQLLAAGPKEFLKGVRPRIREKRLEEILTLDCVKFQLALKSLFVNKVQMKLNRLLTLCSATNRRPFSGPAKSRRLLTRPSPHLLELLENWTQRGSGWTVHRVQTLWPDIAKYQPLRGSSYIPLPAAVKSRKAVVNMKNKDDHCLRCSLRSALFLACDHVDRPSKYPTSDDLNFKGKGIDAPTPISQIPKMEK